MKRRPGRIIDTSSRTGKLVMGILALIAEFENDIRRERQQDEIDKAKAAGVRFGPKPILTLTVIEKVKALREDGATVPEIMRRTKLRKASVYRALGGATPATVVARLNGSPVRTTAGSQI